MALYDYTKDPKMGGISDYCLRCGKEIKDMSKAEKGTFNCDIFEVVLGHDVDTGHPNQQIVGNELLGSDYAKAIGLTTHPTRRRDADA